MPVHRVQQGGKPGYRWGKRGTIYFYTPNNERSRANAKSKAAKQGRAIESSRKKLDSKNELDFEQSMQPIEEAEKYNSYLQRRNVRRSGAMSKAVLKSFRKLTKKRDSEDEEEEDSLQEREDTVRSLGAVMATVVRSWNEKRTIHPIFIRQVGREVERHSRTQTTKMLLTVEDGRVRPSNKTSTAQRRKAISAFVRKNVELIKSIDEEYFDRVARKITDAYLDGASGDSMAKILKKEFGTSMEKSIVIARDQSSKLNNLLSRQQMTYAGASHYKWITSSDSRVRPSHKANARLIFSWSDPPKTGHPGHDVQCRCVAIAVFDGSPELLEYQKKSANPTKTAKGSKDFLSGSNN